MVTEISSCKFSDISPGEACVDKVNLCVLQKLQAPLAGGEDYIKVGEGIPRKADPNQEVHKLAKLSALAG